MIKHILIYFLIFFGIFFLSFSTHENYIDTQEVILPFSLQKVYVFHLGFSVLVCVNFRLFSNVDKIFPQLGFIYLVALFLKIVLFCALFYQSIFNEENLSQIARVSLFIPMLIFLSTEAFFVAKILNKKE
ncbi:hypothetical protein BST83_16480 [Polaribacter filamentus]|uniref:Uncharacterized protein n=1 Tax=Polaribacter filamentus TaxID=53483 RepID=A0A2S7L0X6_9FLAO|nr:DUF6168 family protein [Polaribacter filamentus]PQB08540.1 hypothetical protein BST83_16480 [Polaribacter filamentus]